MEELSGPFTGIDGKVRENTNIDDFGSGSAVASSGY